MNGIFLKDLKENHLKENGEVFLLLNKEKESGLYFSDALSDYIKTQGASIDDRIIHYRTMAKFKV